MKIKSVILLLSCVVTVTACTNKKKQTLRDNQQEKAKLEELYVFEETLDTIIPHPGIKYAEKRDIDPQNPPVTINLDNPEKNKELDVSRFYSQVEYVKVKHPLSEQGVAFLGNSEYEVIYPQGAMMGSGANSRVFLMEDKLIVGDNFFGYYCFDGAGNFYRYGKQLTIRQAYNDTIFRLSADKMIPAFVLNLGSKKPDMQTALKGDKKGKLFIEKLLETDDFLLIVYSENYDSPNNRKSGAVTFFYSYYDKKAGKCRSIPSNQFPERFTLKNGIEGAIPLMLCNAAIYKDQLYASYTKNQLTIVRYKLK